MDPGTDPGGGGGGGGGFDFVDAGPVGPCNKMDIVFVVDDSGSMAEEQANLAANFPEFIRVIDEHRTSVGEELDYRVAVTTTGRDVDYTIALPPPFSFTLPMSEQGHNGEFLQRCDMPRRWLERDDPGVADTFACAAQVGTGGPGLEMPFHALELSLTDRMADGTNAGFLRDDALFAFVILTDEDDCSRRDNNFTIENDQCDPPGPEHITIDEMLGLLDNLTGDRGRWATAVIAGPGPGSCQSDFGQAIEAKRLKQFVQQAGQNAVFSSICDGDLAGAMADALATFEAACESFPPID
jgi:hypothetical protein